MAGRGARAATLAVMAVWALASGCALGGKGRRAQEGRRGFEQTGIASWYGPGFHGRLTANGETYDMEAMTAAHKGLPFGSVVEVLNRENGRKTRVRINDRGPFVRGRIIDLSKAAAREIGMLGSGIARVRIRVVGRSGSSSYQSRPAGSTYTVQAGAFGDRRHAEARLAAVRVLYSNARLEASGGLYRVLVSDLTRSAAREVVQQLHRRGIEAIIRS